MITTELIPYHTGTVLNQTITTSEIDIPVPLREYCPQGLGRHAKWIDTSLASARRVLTDPPHPAPIFRPLNGHRVARSKQRTRAPSDAVVGTAQRPMARSGPGSRPERKARTDKRGCRILRRAIIVSAPHRSASGTSARRTGAVRKSLTTSDSDRARFSLKVGLGCRQILLNHPARTRLALTRIHASGCQTRPDLRTSETSALSGRFSVFPVDTVHGAYCTVDPGWGVHQLFVVSTVKIALDGEVDWNILCENLLELNV